MAVTFNRKPNGVSVPTLSDVRQHYFNHFNWKGINQNKNFLAVDQETFADAKNVYVDDQGLLKSRLPVKFRHKFSDKNVKDLMIFDNIIVCVYIDVNGDWCIGIIEDEEWIVGYSIVADYPLKAFKNGNYIYIFTNQGILSYDSDDKFIRIAELYTPITRIYYGGNFEDFESKNVLTNSVRYQYILYPNVSSGLNVGDDNYYTPDYINGNIYGKVGTYTHYINENKITHSLTFDADGSYKSIVHQPLTSDVSGFKIINAYHTEVCGAFIYNDFIYKFTDNKLLRASTSDSMFDTIYYETDWSVEQFVKIKRYEDIVYLLYTDGYVSIDLVSGEVDRKYITNLIDLTANGVDVSYLYIVDDYTDLNGNGYFLYWRFSKNNVVTHVALGNVSNYLEGSNGEPMSDIKFSTELYDYKDENYSAYDSCGLSIQAGLNEDYMLINDVIVYKKNIFYCFTGKVNESTSGSAMADYEYSGNASSGYTGLVQCNIYCEKSQIDEPKIYAIMGRSRHLTYDYVYYGLLTLNYSSTKPTIMFENEIQIEINSKQRNFFVNGNLYQFGVNYSTELLVNSQLISDKAAVFLMPNFSDYWFYIFEDEEVILSNYKRIATTVNVLIEGEQNNLNITAFSHLNGKLFIGQNNRIDIGQIILDPDDGNEKIYVRESDYHILDENINGFHKISDNEIGIFCNNSTWYNVLSDGIYYYNSSKIVPTLKNKSELITLPDSTTTLMPSQDGIVALSYQNFVNTTEQSTINLTENLSNIYNKLKNDIRCLNWKSYTMFYERDNSIIIVYDNRFGAWWRWEISIELSKLFIYDNNLYALSNGSIYEFSNSNDNYFDLVDGVRKPIDWFIESQKLHLNANNYYKHISNLTLSSVEENDVPISLDLNVKNYRKWVDNGKAENFDYHIDVIRTYVKRVNYAKVCEFQYRLSSDNDVAISSPLALSGVVIKYKIGGQVR